MAPVKIKLYVDTVSPFGYEAYYILRVSTAGKVKDLMEKRANWYVRIE